MADHSLSPIVASEHPIAGPSKPKDIELEAGDDDVPLELLERELPFVDHEQIPLRELLQRIMQSIYAELSEMAETLPGMSDAARKRTLADWVVKTKKQVVKLYAVAKWSRDADVVQKCMNITAFLMGQNQQFEDVTRALRNARDMLDPARLRNHDLLTSLDVLTTGSYLRLPTCIKKYIVPKTPLTDAEVCKTLSDIEEAIQFRLRMSEIIPVEMAQYRIADGRVYFMAPNLFEASLCLSGVGPDDGWFFVNVEFLIEVGGDVATLQEFPRIPKGIMKRHIMEEADSRLGLYVQRPEPEQLYPPGFEPPPRPKLPPGYVDTPLVRIFNFLQMMSLSYQLEILWYQAERMRALGWASYMSVQMTRDRKSMAVSYWLRPPLPPVSGQQHQKFKLPLLGGKVTVSIVETHGPPQAGPGPERTPKSRMFAKLQRKAKLGNSRPSDEVEGLRFEVKWQPEKGALGVIPSPDQLVLPEELLQVKSECLDFEAMLKAIIEKHTAAILMTFQYQLQTGVARAVFGPPGVVTRITELGSPALCIHLCVDEVVVITIDPRTGRITLRDSGDLAAAGRGPRFTAVSTKINENPTMLFSAVVHLRFMTIAELVDQKAKYLGLQSYRTRNLSQVEMAKLGPDIRGSVYIQLASFPDHYLVVLITDEQFRFALITTEMSQNLAFPKMLIVDICWLVYDRLRQESLAMGKVRETLNPEVRARMKKKSDIERQPGFPDFDLETQMLRELYTYCCARVAYKTVEWQLKIQQIPFTHVSPSYGLPITLNLAHTQSSLVRSIPGICVQSKDILSGVPAAEAAMPNIRVVALRWWSEKSIQVVTCVKLKYVQQPMGKTAGGAIIRPSKGIIYDTKEAVVSFFSENVKECMKDFVKEWARVSKMVVIAREVGQMSKGKKWPDIQLLSFDLQTVEFAYAENYTVSITCEDQLSPTGGHFVLRFARRKLPSVPKPLARNAREAEVLMDEDIREEESFNPHDDAEPFFRDMLQQGNDSEGHGRLAPSLHRLVALLRETLPVVVELEAIRRDEEKKNRVVDILPKAAGWYRLLYGDLRHALDFRLMTNQRIAILDGSYSLHPSSSPSLADSTFSTQSLSSSSSMTTIATTSTLKKSNARTCGESNHGVLQPIPYFREIIAEVVKDGLMAGDVRPGKIARVDTGVVCECTTVHKLARAIHVRVVEALMKSAPVSCNANGATSGSGSGVVKPDASSAVS